MTDLGRPRGSVTSAVASSALATGAVVALLVGLNFGFGSPADGAAQAPGEAVAEQADLADLAAAHPARPYGPVPVAEPDVGAAAPPEARPAEPATPAAARPPQVAVVVLNQTVRRGLAAEFRSVLAAAGWRVGGVGDFRGNVPATTVYYPEGMKAEARALAAAFGQVDRIRPAFPGIPADKLTVILCKDYPRT